LIKTEEYAIIDSLKKLAKLENTRLFPASGTVRDNPRQDIVLKIAYLEEESSPIWPSYGPLIVDNANQIPGSLFLFKYQPQAPPVKACKSRIEPFEVILNGDGAGIDFGYVVDGVPPSDDLVVANCVRPSEVGVIDEPGEVRFKGKVYWLT